MATAVIAKNKEKGNDMLLADKREKVAEILKNLDKVLIAFSGGTDSAYLLKKSLDVLGKDNVLAVTAFSEIHPLKELAEAKVLASNMGAHHLVVSTSELTEEIFTQNTRERCYFCKKSLFILLQGIACREGFRQVLDGANFDDLQDYRPGSRAAVELGIRSPLQEAGMSKEDVRRASYLLGLPTWDKSAQACLATRFPYGQKITKEKLRQVEKAEEFLQNLGFTQIRVRHHGSVARLEVLPEEQEKVLTKAAEISAAFKKVGFTYAALDLSGYRQGSMNE